MFRFDLKIPLKSYLFCLTSKTYLNRIRIRIRSDPVFRGNPDPDFLNRIHGSGSGVEKNGPDSQHCYIVNWIAPFIISHIFPHFYCFSILRCEIRRYFQSFSLIIFLRLFVYTYTNLPYYVFPLLQVITDYRRD